MRGGGVATARCRGLAALDQEVEQRSATWIEAKIGRVGGASDGVRQRTHPGAIRSYSSERRDRRRMRRARGRSAGELDQARRIVVACEPRLCV